MRWILLFKALVISDLIQREDLPQRQKTEKNHFETVKPKQNCQLSSLAVQWQRLHAPKAGGQGSIPGQGTRSHVLQLNVCMLQLKIPPATTKTQCSQINNKK